MWVDYVQLDNESIEDFSAFHCQESSIMNIYINIAERERRKRDLKKYLELILQHAILLLQTVHLQNLSAAVAAGGNNHNKYQD